jgi:hypothetical protein
MSQNPAFDSSIPVLTEVVLEPLPVQPAGQAETEEAADAVAAADAAAAPVQAAPQPLPEPDWDELERRIAERVVAQLQPQLDAVVRNALASAADQIHVGLRQSVEQVVAQQVAALQFGQK